MTDRVRNAARTRCAAGVRARAPVLASMLAGGWFLAEAWFASFAAHADSRALEGVPLPPGAGSRLVASDILQNGRVLSIATLEPRGTFEETLDFYREAWPADDDDPGHVESSVGEWSVIGRLADETNLVVQLKDGTSGIEGFVSAMSIAAAGSSPAGPPPMPAGGRLLSMTAAHDAGLRSETSVVESTARAAEVAAFYRDAMRRNGWRLVSDRSTGGPVSLLFDARRARLEIVVTDIDGGSVVVINEVHDGD